MSLHRIKIAYSALEAKGKLEPTDVINILLTETSKRSDQIQKKITDTLKTYPKEYELFKKRMDQIWESLDKLKEMI
jgi:polyhydroxyalkanoate synthesis regulator phasin